MSSSNQDQKPSPAPSQPPIAEEKLEPLTVDFKELDDGNIELVFSQNISRLKMTKANMTRFARNVARVCLQSPEEFQEFISRLLDEMIEDLKFEVDKEASHGNS